MKKKKKKTGRSILWSENVKNGRNVNNIRIYNQVELRG